MTPQAVIKAGRREKNILWLNEHVEPNRVQDGRGPAPAYNPVLFEGTYAQCRDFIDGRVFKAMLREQARHYRYTSGDKYEPLINNYLVKLAEGEDG